MRPICATTSRTVLDEAIVVDNGSTDGTFELLVELAEELPLQLASEIGHVYQSGRVTRMARFAAQQGADWVLPIDADEFWVARDVSFRSVLEQAPVDARALFVDVINFVQRHLVRQERHPVGLSGPPARGAPHGVRRVRAQAGARPREPHDHQPLVQPPDVIVGPSGGIDAQERAGTCRIVHVDGGHRYDVVRQDVVTARTLLGPDGLVAFGNIFTPHKPGVALAVRELVLGGEFVPLCITESKLYGTWDHDAVAWVTAGNRGPGGRPAGPGEGHPHPGRVGRAVDLRARTPPGER